MLDSTNYKTYKSTPVTRVAHEITEKDIIRNRSRTTSLIEYPDGTGHTFDHFRRPKIGDYIVFEDMADIYLVAKKKFEDRYSPEDTE